MKYIYIYIYICRKKERKFTAENCNVLFHHFCLSLLTCELLQKPKSLLLFSADELLPSGGRARGCCTTRTESVGGGVSCLTSPRRRGRWRTVDRR